MRVFASLLLAASSVFAYQVTSPGNSQGWNNTGPNFLNWQRVDTDPPNFAVYLTNSNIGYDEILDPVIDGTLGTVQCSTPSGGWPSGDGFRVNLAQNAQNPNALLAQSNQFNITNVLSNATTTSASTGMTTSAATGTASSTGTTPSTPSASGSDTSTTPTATSAALLGADARGGWLTAAAALIAFVITLF